MQIDSDFIKRLQSEMGLGKATDVIREGLTILNWAVQESNKGRVVLSADQEGEKVVRLAMPVLEQIRQR